MAGKKASAPKNPKEAADKATAKKKSTSSKKTTKKVEPEVVKVAIEAPVEEIKAEEPKKTPVKPKPAPARIGPADKMKALLAEYEELCKKPAFNASMRKNMVQKLSNIIQFAIRNAETKAVLDAMFTFFVKERRGILAEEVVFQGISSLGNSTRMQMEIFYSAMMICVSNKITGKKRPIDLDRVREILKSEKVVAFFSSKCG